MKKFTELLSESKTKYVKSVMDKLEASGFTAGKKKMISKSEKTGFMPGETWADAGFGTAYKKISEHPILKDGQQIGAIIIIDEKVPGMRGMWTAYLKKGDKTFKQELASDYGGYIGIDQIIAALEGK